MDFDPSRISYEQLLAVFWASHHPGSRPWSRQYMNAVFYHNEAQQRLALASQKQVAEKIKGEVYYPGSAGDGLSAVAGRGS